MPRAKKKGSPPSFQFYPADFTLSTAMMEGSEVGAYIRLLCAQWEHGGLPNNPKKLARLSGAADFQEFEEIWSVLESKFEVCEDGQLRQARLEREREKQKRYRKSQSEKGKKSAESRKKGPKESATEGGENQPKSNRGSTAVATPASTAVQPRHQPEGQPDTQPEGQPDTQPKSNPLSLSLSLSSSLSSDSDSTEDISFANAHSCPAPAEPGSGRAAVEDSSEFPAPGEDTPPESAKPPRINYTDPLEVLVQHPRLKIPQKWQAPVVEVFQAHLEAWKQHVEPEHPRAKPPVLADGTKAKNACARILDELRGGREIQELVDCCRGHLKSEFHLEQGHVGIEYALRASNAMKFLAAAEGIRPSPGSNGYEVPKSPPGSVCEDGTIWTGETFVSPEEWDGPIIEPKEP